MGSWLQDGEERRVHIWDILNERGCSGCKLCVLLNCFTFIELEEECGPSSLFLFDALWDSLEKEEANIRSSYSTDVTLTVALSKNR